MPAYARRQIVAEGEVGVYHCIGRCVRRALLCGSDPLTGRDFSHRRRWLVERLKHLAGLFAVDVLGFAVMTNHFHLIVRTRPDLAAAWDDAELVRRWSGLRATSATSDGAAEVENRSHGSAEAIEAARLVADPARASELRRRLSGLSWLMRCLCEPLARWANREDKCTGHFWEGRFKSQALLDEAAVLACSIYVDLNPIRAGVAATPETSECTSAWERIAGLVAACDVPAAGESDDPAAESLALADPVDWLAPVADDDVRRAAALRGESTSATSASAASMSAAGSSVENSSVAGSGKSGPARRASDRGFLPFGLDDYLRLLDWTGRQLRRDSDQPGHGGAIPADLAPILSRLGLAAAEWPAMIRQFGRWWRWAIGSPSQMERWRQRLGRRWLHGATASRLAFS